MCLFFSVARRCCISFVSFPPCLPGTCVQSRPVMWGVPPGNVTTLQKSPIVRIRAVGSCMVTFIGAALPTATLPSAATASSLSAEILHHEYHAVCVAQWCVVRLALREAHRVLPDTHVLKGVFRALDIQPGYPSFSQFFSESVLYLRFSPQPKQAKLYYIGSAAKCTTACEHTRFRKYKQVVEEKLVSAELALRYWAEKRTFWHWRSVPF